MSLHHFRISLRHLLRNKVYGLVNLLGLSVGIASVLLIALYVRHELSYDKFFEDSDSIYRLALHRVYPDRVRDFASSAITLAPALEDNYPEVRAITRMHRLFFANEVNVRLGEEIYAETRFLYGDEAFFDVFSHPFLHGNPATALDAADKVVLTESTAQKYFGRTDVLNETLRVNRDTADYRVSGVIRDVPSNAHFGFDLIGSIHAINYLENAIETNAWINPWVYTYVKLAPGTDPIVFEAKVAQAVDQYGAASIARQLGADYADVGHRFDYFLQPLTDIHLQSNVTIEVEPNSDIMYVYLLSLIALIILIISTINYVNLSVARAPARAREVGIRKVVGSRKGSLITQFLIEALVVCGLSALFALVITGLMMPYFNDLLGTSLSMEPLQRPLYLGVFLVFVVLVSVLSGAYPALVISSYKPAKILKGTFSRSAQGHRLRNGLTTVQFIISTVMISGSVLVHQQMNYFKNKDLGFNVEDVLVIRQANRLGDQYESFKHEVRALPGVLGVGGANGLPGDFLGSGVFKTANPEASDLRANTANFDDDFLTAIDFSLVDGRFFDRNFNDSLSIIINEAAVHALGLQEPVGERFWSAGGGNNGDVPVLTVVGVVQDYHFSSLHAEIGPLVIFNTPPQSTPPNLVVNVRSEDLDRTIASIERQWSQMADDAFAFSFLDQDLQAQYEADTATAFLFDIFTYVAIIMCCIGLFALATFTAQQRRKEMSIRKVLGASIGHILLSFSREFMMIVGIAFLVGIPLSYYSMDKWLQNFAYHVPISGFTFLMAALLLVFFVVVTLSYQAFRLATVSPADSLRTE